MDQVLERMVKDGVIDPVECAEWAAPIFPVMKQDGSVRICGDYKTRQLPLTLDRSSVHVKLQVQYI